MRFIEILKNNKKLAILHIITLKISLKKNEKILILNLHSLIDSKIEKVNIIYRGNKIKLEIIFNLKLKIIKIM